MIGYSKKTRGARSTRSAAAWRCASCASAQLHPAPTGVQCDGLLAAGSAPAATVDARCDRARVAATTEHCLARIGRVARALPAISELLSSDVLRSRKLRGGGAAAAAARAASRAVAATVAGPEFFALLQGTDGALDRSLGGALPRRWRGCEVRGFAAAWLRAGAAARRLGGAAGTPTVDGRTRVLQRARRCVVPRPAPWRRRGGARRVEIGGAGRGSAGRGGALRGGAQHC